MPIHSKLVCVVPLLVGASPSSCCTADLLYSDGWGDESQESFDEAGEAPSQTEDDGLSTEEDEDSCGEECESALCGNGELDEGEDCDGGPCCKHSCRFEAESVVCDAMAVEYGCPWGSVPGSNVGVRTGQRQCTGKDATCEDLLVEPSGWDLQEECADYRVCEPGLATCVCVATTRWYPQAVGDTVPAGTFYPEGVETLSSITGARLEVSEVFPEGSFVIRVCKLQDPPTPFWDAIYLRFESTDGQVLFDGEIPQPDNECTEYVELAPMDPMSEGALFGGSWQLSSPAKTHDHWLAHCEDSGTSEWGTPGGWCWSSEGIPQFERTCLD